MKKLFAGLWACGLFCGGVFAAPTEPLRVSQSAKIEQGYLDETVVLTDSDGGVFLEFPKSLKVLYSESKAAFDGELLSPVKIELPDQSPRTRMKELYSFDLVSDAGEPLFFTDRISTLHQRNRMRELILNPENTESGSRPKLLFVLQDDSVRNPRLWRYISEEEGWSRVGGVVSESGEKRIFSAKISLTGKYSIFDESPISTDAFEDYIPEETIESLSAKIERLQSQLHEMKAEEGLFDGENEIFFEQQSSLEDEALFESQEFFEEIPGIENSSENSQENFEDNRTIPASSPATGDLVLPPGESFGSGTSLSSDLSIPDGAMLPQTGIKEEISKERNPWWIFVGTIFSVFLGGGVYVFWKGVY